MAYAGLVKVSLLRGACHCGILGFEGMDGGGPTTGHFGIKIQPSSDRKTPTPAAADAWGWEGRLRRASVQNISRGDAVSVSPRQATAEAGGDGGVSAAI